MSSVPKSNTTLYIIIGAIIFCICCCVSSSLGALLFYNFFKEPEVGKVGGKCFENLTCKSPYICIKGECYQDCEPDLTSTNCRNNHKFPRYNAYYCDVGKCNDWWTEPGIDDYDEYTDIFKNALLADQEAKRIQAEEKAQRKIQAEQLQTERELEEARQKELCQCSTFSGIRLKPYTYEATLCEKGQFGGDGDEVLNWCYVSGGQDCKTANRSVNPKTPGMAWKLC